MLRPSLRRALPVLAAFVVLASAGSCLPTGPADKKSFNVTEVTEIWQFSDDNGNVAQVQMIIGSTGGGTLDSDGPPNWVWTSWDCKDPLVISGDANPGTNSASISFSLNSKGGCSVLYAVQGYALTGTANAPSMLNATQASGTMHVSYQDRHTPSYSWTQDFRWHAVRVK